MGDEIIVQVLGIGEQDRINLSETALVEVEGLTPENTPRPAAPPLRAR